MADAWGVYLKARLALVHQWAREGVPGVTPAGVHSAPAQIVQALTVDEGQVRLLLATEPRDSDRLITRSEEQVLEAQIAGLERDLKETQKTVLEQAEALQKKQIELETMTTEGLRDELKDRGWRVVLEPLE